MRKRLLESDLRSLRTPPRRAFSASLAIRVQQGRHRTRRPLGLAIALSGAVVVSLAATGSLGYAASASERTIVAIRHVVYPVVKKERSVARDTPAQAQYQVAICHKTNVASRPWTQLSVNTASVKTYLTRGDFIVTPATPCPPTTPVSCSIRSIVGRNIAVSCTAGTARAGKACSLKIRLTIVAKGTVTRTGKFSTKFTVASPLTQGTRILFLVSGKTLTSVRV
jgi:hypothetical protein